MLGILDYGLGNIKSISNMLQYLNIDYIFVKDKLDFLKINKLIIPGIGSFDAAMMYLNQKEFVKEIYNFSLNENNFIFGICLGMQLLGKKSNEGSLSGLKLINFEVKSLASFTYKNIPHMGWSEVIKNNFDYRPMLNDRYYFVHSYFVPIPETNEEYESIMICNYGFKFSAAIRKNNIYGFQFHPEKSHEYGMELFKFIDKL